jgi:hypothetical protein
MTSYALSWPWRLTIRLQVGGASITQAWGWSGLWDACLASLLTCTTTVTARVPIVVDWSAMHHSTKQYS